jgi:YD repeat-containing protein
LRSTTDDLAPTRAITYDGLDRVKTATATDPTGIREAVRTSYGYKAGGQVESMTVGTANGDASAQSYTTTYGYDRLERVTRLGETASGGLSFTRTFGYDANSNLVSETDRRGVTTTYGYDGLNYVTSAEASGVFGQGLRTTLAPDKVGNALSVTDSHGQTVASGYDGLHRLTSQTNAESRTKRYEYDGENLTRESDYKGVMAQYRYDDLNRVKEIIDRAGQLTAIAYDDRNGLTKTVTDRRGNQRAEQYDALGRLTSASAGLLPVAAVSGAEQSFQRATLFSG